MKDKHVKGSHLGVHRLHLSSPFSFQMKGRRTKGSPVRVHRRLRPSDVKGVNFGEQKVDYISELPDCILSYIQSKISIKDMMNTSLLSKRWCNLWHLRRDLNFDVANVLGSDGKLPKRRCINMSRDEIFVKRVDQFVKNFKGTKIDSFMVEFDFNLKPSSRCIDEWIRFAIARGVERINLHTPNYAYKFPFGLSLECNNSTLEHMYLRHCEVYCPKNSKNFDIFPFTNLRSLVLQSSYVDVSLLTALLSNCLLLVEFSLIRCSFKSSFFKIESSSLWHLKLENCEDDNHYEDLDFILDCPKLTTFHYDKASRGSWLSMNTPILKTTYYTVSPDSEKIHQAFNLFATLPKLETLDLYIYNTFEVTPLQSIQTLKNLREFNLSIDATYEDFSIWWILPLLQASPFLQKLSVMMRHSRFHASQRDNQDLIMFSHCEIKVIELGGCVGNWYEIEFVMNALKYFHKLEQIVLSPYCTIKGFGGEDFMKYNPIWFEKGRERILEKLEGEGIELDKLILKE